MRRVRVDFAREARVFAGYLQDIPQTNTKYYVFFRNAGWMVNIVMPV